MNGSINIAGVGETPHLRGTDKSYADMSLQAALLACADAGILPCSVDGVVIAGYRGRIEDIAAGLDLSDLKFSSRVEMGGASPAAALVHAVAAVESGRAERVLVVAVRFGYSQARFSRGSESVRAHLTRFFPGEDIRTQLEHPHGLLVPMQYYALQATRWFADYGLPPDAMAPVALAMRENASRNPRAVMGGRPMSMDQYLESPLIASPFRMLDCCVETDGAAALLVSVGDSDRSDGLSRVRIAGAAEAHPPEPDDIVSRGDMIDIGLTKAAPRAFAEAGIGPEDLDFAELYDCFTYTVLRQLEVLGFCSPGESPAFVRERGITIDGKLPINTHGGLLSDGHVLGMNHIVEAVRQLRGDAGERQLENPRWGIATGFGDFGDGSMVVLTNQ
jgi:acetyl-CoA acetyltransferase